MMDKEFVSLELMIFIYYSLKSFFTSLKIVMEFK